MCHRYLLSAPLWRVPAAGIRKWISLHSPIRLKIATQTELSLAGQLNPKLPHSRVEVQRISGLYRMDKTTILIGKEATETKLKTLPLPMFGTIHRKFTD